jgi:hypothetical protein
MMSSDNMEDCLIMMMLTLRQCGDEDEDDADNEQ